MSASAVFVLDLKGKVLICRNYKGDVDMSEIDHFFSLLMLQEEEGLVCPVMSHGNVHFLWIKHSNLYSVIPPDGESELMSYRINTHVKPLIWIESVIEKFSHSRVEIMVKAKGQFKKQSVANNVEIRVPVPSDADSPKFKTSTGHAKYVPEKNLVVWSIKSFPGGKELLMRAHFGLPSVENHELEGKPPITVRFEIPYFTVSGIQVRYMKIIEKSGYQALPWVRYITQSGDYQLRTNS
ncbi:AP-1 complex subunit mu-2-like [Sinocyclocheilus grahami]|uniref:AP-1 complex subunit mu-2-like n=1 Tax=Sinocyclocheilus grahami TaxID=75366 RepID=A0A672KKE5_SINGR|nr:PREDICTED: AP-1 complex subunit mu-2-like [Sinocyclocheilus grahami]